MESDNRTQKTTSLKTLAFGLIFLFFSASLLFGALIIYKLAVPNIEKQILSVLAGLSSDHTVIMISKNDIVNIIKQIQQRVLWMLIVCLLAGAIIFFLVIRTILNRLNNIRIVAAKMAEGRLDETIPFQRLDEIGAIGKVINDFAANLQEVLLLLWNQTQNCLRQVKKVNKYEIYPEMMAGMDVNLQQMQNGLEDMQSMIRSFNFYGVCLDDGLLIARHDQEETFLNSTGDSND